MSNIEESDIVGYSKIAEYAKKLESEGKYEEALTYLEMDIEQKTAPYDVRKDMGRILNKMGKFEDALKSFDLVLAMNNKHPECWFGKGVSYLMLFRWFDAYKSFLRSSELDETNANSWYYMAIILKDFRWESQSKMKFKTFLEYDNEEFQIERECYKCGLIFEQIKNELFESKKKINIIDFRNELKSLKVDSNEIDYYLHCLPYEKLVEKILFLRESNYENTVKEIIIDELRHRNITNSDIHNMLLMESLDSLKEKIISLKGSNPFPPLELDLNMPYYVPTLKGHVDKHIKRDYMAIPNVSQFNILAEIKVENFNKDYFNNKKIRINPITMHENKKKAKKYFKRGKDLISEKNKDGIKFLKEALDIYPKDDVMNYKIKFYLATVLSRWGYLEKAFHYYMELRNSQLDYQNFDIFLLNFANLCYDFGYYFDAINYYNGYLRINPDCEVVKILKNSAKNMI